VAGDGTTNLWVTEGKVTLTTVKKTGLAPSPSTEWLTVTPLGEIIGDLLDWLL
jgi:hypothetical protein